MEYPDQFCLAAGVCLLENLGEPGSGCSIGDLKLFSGGAETLAGGQQSGEFCFGNSETEGGLEAVIRFPVDRKNAAEIDGRVTQELLKAIEREPGLKPAGSVAANLKLRTDLTPSEAPG